VENTNRRVRRHLPREIDMRQLTDADIRAVTDRMNATPRKCLGWRTPAEVFAENMVEIGDRRPYPPEHGKSPFT
jgi:IS30 family transposase